MVKSSQANHIRKMNRIIGYAMIESDDADKMAQEVLRIITEEGFQPFGSPFCNYIPNDTDRDMPEITMFYQAVVKYDTEPMRSTR